MKFDATAAPMLLVLVLLLLVCVVASLFRWRLISDEADEEPSSVRGHWHILRGLSASASRASQPPALHADSSDFRRRRRVLLAIS